MIRKLLISCILVLCVGDVITTEIALRLGASEGNPIMEGVVEYPAIHLVVKLLLFLTIVLITQRIETVHPAAGPPSLLILYGVLLIPVLNNTFWIYALSGL